MLTLLGGATLEIQMLISIEGEERKGEGYSRRGLERKAAISDI